MKYERTPVIPYPHGAEPRLDDSLRYLEIAALTEFKIETADEQQLPEIERAQLLHESFMKEIHTDGTHYLVARDDEGRIVGTAAYSFGREGTAMNLDTLAVHPDYQSQGIGSGLLAEATQHGIDQGAQLIMLISMGKESTEFYRRHGFRDNDPDDKSTMRIMSKDLG